VRARRSVSQTVEPTARDFRKAAREAEGRCKRRPSQRLDAVADRAARRSAPGEELRAGRSDSQTSERAGRYARRPRRRDELAEATMTAPRRILGIDPGLAITGYGVI